MVQFRELKHRIKREFSYSQQELVGLIAVIVIAAFIFSFRDWGEEQLDVVEGLTNLFTVLIIAAITFFFRTACQKIYALSDGYKTEFRISWIGMGISLLVTFMSLGTIPLLFPGITIPSFVTRLRLGEFRYGYSQWNAGIIAAWASISSIILAIFFGIGVHYFPQSYFFNKGLFLNFLLAIYSIIPLPQVEGLGVFFGSRVLYIITAVLVILEAILLISKTTFGLIFAIIIAAIYGSLYLLVGSEK